MTSPAPNLVATTGTVLIITDPTGTVQAVSASFDSRCLHNLSLEKSQRERATRNAWREVVKKLASKQLAEVVLTMISTRHLDLLRNAARQKGWAETWKVLSVPGADPGKGQAES